MRVRPDAVINCVGVVKQLAAAKDPIASITINSLFPHVVARLAPRVIQISTDCVFSGSKGRYREEDVSDAKDLYGRSKYLGEVDYPHAVTLRTELPQASRVVIPAAANLRIRLGVSSM